MGKRNRNTQRTVLIVLCIVLTLLLAGLAGAAVLYNHYYNKLGQIGDENTVPPDIAASIMQSEYEGNTDDPTSATPGQNVTVSTEDVEHEGQGEHIINILLVGQDAREGEGRQRSDTMILMTFNTSQKTITLTSFMRDQYVQIPGYGATKLCHAYKYGGMNLLNETIYNHFGVEIDGNIEINFTSFEKIINMLGGVEITLTEAESEYMHQAGYKSLKTGKNLLNGEQALLYARLRSIDTDYNRAERQRNVVMSLFDAYKGQSYGKMLSLLNEILPLIKTNMSQGQILEYAARVFPMISGTSIDTMRIPVEGTFDGGYVRVWEGLDLWCQLNIDFEANRKVLNEIFAE